MKVYQVITTLRYFEDSSISVWTNEFQSEEEAINYIHNEAQKKQYYSDVTINQHSASAYDEGLNQEYNWELNELDIYVDYVKEFSMAEGEYRLKEVFEIPEEQISDELLNDTVQTIQDIFEYYDPFYDTIDYNIQRVLEKHRLR